MTNAENRYYLAIDVGGMSVKFGLYSVPSGSGIPQLTAKSTIPTRTENSGCRILPDIADAIQRQASEAGISLSDIAGIGIGVPGPVILNEDGRSVVNGCVNLNWPDVVDVIGYLEEKTGIGNICLLNDANAAALGEYRFGLLGSGGEDDEISFSSGAVMITIGTGIGGGIITGGNIVTGAFGAAGEVGHMPCNPPGEFLHRIHGKDPSMPLRADLEYYASAAGLIRMTAAALAALDQDSSLRTLPADHELTAKDIIDAAKAGDALASDAVSFFFDTLGQGLASITSVTDPDLFIIGGGVAAAGDYLLEGLKKAYREYVFRPSRETAFRLAVLGNDAGLIGAIAPLV